jgi:hypothetical protein
VRITIDHPSPDGLTQESWTFWISDSYKGRDKISAVLDEYALWHRPSTRHKLRVQAKWERLSHGRCWGANELDAPVEPPQWVCDAVVKRITEAIAFLVETEKHEDRV